jgi:hypothetical protein
MLNTNSKTKSSDIKKQTQFVFFWTTLVVIYIFIEWIFNQHLLHVMSLDEISGKDFSKTVLIGKITLSIGLNLIIKGLYQYKQWWKFAVGTFASFIVLTAVYMEAVESFPPELRYASYYGAIHKKEVIEIKDKEKLLDIKEDGWYTKPLLLTHYMFTLDNKKWLEFQNRVTEPVTREVSAFAKNKNKHFESYQKAEDARKELDNSWKAVVEAKEKYEAVRYNKKAKRAEKKAAIDAFRAKTGIEPSTTQEEFYKENSKDYNRALTVQIFPGYIDGGVAPIHVKDLPQDMNQEKFYKYIDIKVKEIKSKLTPSMKEIRNARKAPEVVNTLALPPIMLSLSLISIAFNFLILISMWLRLLGKTSQTSSEVIMPIYFALTLFLFAILVIVKPTMTKQYSYWDNAEQTLTVKYPGLAAFWKIGLKLEPIICITNNAPGIAVGITKTIYKK